MVTLLMFSWAAILAWRADSMVDCNFVGWVRPNPSHFNDWVSPDEPKIMSRVCGELGPLHTPSKSHDHEIVRAQKKVFKGCLQNHVVWS